MDAMDDPRKSADASPTADRPVAADPLPPYEPPTLVSLGHLNDLTAAGSFFGDT